MSETPPVRTRITACTFGPVAPDSIQVGPSDVEITDCVFDPPLTGDRQMKYELGDIIISGSKGNNWLGRAIRLFTRSPGEPATRATHVAMVLGVAGKGRLIDCTVIEAVSKGVKLHRYGKPYKCIVYRARDLTEDERDCIYTEAWKLRGTKYGYVRILAHALDWITSGARSYRFRKKVKGGDLAGRECSNVITYLWKKCRGLTFGVPAYAASPDDIDDYCLWNPRKYDVVREWGRYKGRKED